jgi:hypothetical protein
MRLRTDVRMNTPKGGGAPNRAATTRSWKRRRITLHVAPLLHFCIALHVALSRTQKSPANAALSRLLHLSRFKIPPGGGEKGSGRLGVAFLPAHTKLQ